MNKKIWAIIGVVLALAALAIAVYAVAGPNELLSLGRHHREAIDN